MRLVIRNPANSIAYVGLDRRHRPTWASPDGNPVADSEVLKLRENASGTRTIQIAEIRNPPSR
jgi:hypothetical protein